MKSNANKKIVLAKCIETFLYLIGYTISFILISLLFKTFQINEEHLFIYSFVSVLILFILNNTIKPIIFKITLPLTGITMGLFYFIINAGLLKLVDIIMGSKLNFTSMWTLIIIAVLISFTNVIIEVIIIKPIVRRLKKK